jgi:hypothetical protein
MYGKEIQELLDGLKELLADEDALYLITDRLSANLGEVTAVSGARLDLLVYTIIDTLNELEL